MKCQCRGRVQSVRNENGELYFRFKAKTQFNCSDNEVPGSEIFNILFELGVSPQKSFALETTSEIKAKIEFYQIIMASREEDSTIVVESKSATPPEWDLISIKVG